MDVLIYGDTVRSPDLRHAVPVAIADAFLYAERDGRRYVFIATIEAERIRAAVDVEVVPPDELGLDELLAKSVPPRDVRLELLVRGCEAIGLEAAITPDAFPVAVADRLRAAGIEVQPDQPTFDDRRRVKNAAELAGIRRAQAAADEMMAAIRDALRSRDGVTSEELRAEARAVLSGRDITLENPIVAHGPQAASVHEEGSGPVGRDEAVVVDLGVCDGASGCWADMTRTFCAGTPPPEIVEYQRICREAMEQVVAEIRPGVSGARLHEVADGIIAAAGYPTLLTKEPGKPLEDGFLHALGHGVGLEIHEAPRISRVGDPLVAGDVLAIEPGIYRRGLGGCRLEDLVLVTEDGAEVLTRFPYEF
ncbi:MAG TPA: Xaa-Pro peptidase family protein [Gaiella sp.]|nr:Xaa-Pro peptidase family protein [Gaiella sp.]